MKRHPDYFQVMGGPPLPWALLAACEFAAQCGGPQDQTEEEAALLARARAALAAARGER